MTGAGNFFSGQEIKGGLLAFFLSMCYTGFQYSAAAILREGHCAGIK